MNEGVSSNNYQMFEYIPTLPIYQKRKIQTFSLFKKHLKRDKEFREKISSEIINKNIFARRLCEKLEVNRIQDMELYRNEEFTKKKIINNKINIKEFFAKFKIEKDKLKKTKINRKEFMIKIHILELEVDKILKEEINIHPIELQKLITTRYMLFLNDLISSKARSEKSSSIEINHESSFQKQQQKIKEFLDESKFYKQALNESLNLIIKNQKKKEDFYTAKRCIFKEVQPNEAFIELIDRVFRKVNYITDKNMEITEQYVLNLLSQEIDVYIEENVQVGEIENEEEEMHLFNLNKALTRERFPDIKVNKQKAKINHDQNAENITIYLNQSNQNNPDMTYLKTNTNNSNLKHSLSTNITYLIDNQNNSNIQQVLNDDNSSTFEVPLQQEEGKEVRKEKKKTEKKDFHSKIQSKHITSQTQTELKSFDVNGENGKWECENTDPDDNYSIRVIDTQRESKNKLNIIKNAEISASLSNDYLDLDDNDTVYDDSESLKDKLNTEESKMEKAYVRTNKFSKEGLVRLQPSDGKTILFRDDPSRKKNAISNIKKKIIYVNNKMGLIKNIQKSAVKTEIKRAKKSKFDKNEKSIANSVNNVQVTVSQNSDEEEEMHESKSIYEDELEMANKSSYDAEEENEAVEEDGKENKIKTGTYIIVKEKKLGPTLKKIKRANLGKEDVVVDAQSKKFKRKSTSKPKKDLDTKIDKKQSSQEESIQETDSLGKTNQIMKENILTEIKSNNSTNKKLIIMKTPNTTQKISEKFQKQHSNNHLIMYEEDNTFSHKSSDNENENEESEDSDKEEDQFKNFLDDLLPNKDINTDKITATHQKTKTPTYEYKEIGEKRKARKSISKSRFTKIDGFLKEGSIDMKVNKIEDKSKQENKPSNKHSNSANEITTKNEDNNLLSKRGDSEFKLHPKRMDSINLPSKLKGEFLRKNSINTNIKRHESESLLVEGLPKYRKHSKNLYPSGFNKGNKQLSSQFIKQNTLTDDEKKEFQNKLKSMRNAVDKFGNANDDMTSVEANKKQMRIMHDLNKDIEFNMNKEEISEDQKKRYEELMENLESFKKFDLKNYVDNIEKNYQDIQEEMTNLAEITKREERLKYFLNLLQDYRIGNKCIKDSMRNHYKVKDSKMMFNVSPLMNGMINENEYTKDYEVNQANSSSNSINNYETNNKNLVKEIDEILTILLKEPIERTTSFSGRVKISSILLKRNEDKWLERTIIVAGWIKAMKISSKGDFAFVELNDGSSATNLQVIISCNMNNFTFFQEKSKVIGASVLMKGKIISSPGKRQSIEMQILDVDKHYFKIINECDKASYPLYKSKDKTKLEDLRSLCHLRPRTNIFGCITRIRSCLAIATHHFFQYFGFLLVNTPILTQNNCEPDVSLFQISTMMRDISLLHSENKPKKDIDYSNDFFNKPVYLTSSGQLELESYSSSLCDVYSFGPTFRREYEASTRHLAEFWMVECELSFADLSDTMDLAEKYIKFCIKYILKKNKDDLEYIEKFYNKNLTQNLFHLIKDDFQRVSYTSVIDILIEATKSKNAKFKESVTWGISLAEEHEKYLVDNVFKAPIFIYNFPKRIKAFYMRENADDETVASVDLIIPGIGEILGGSQQEERYDILKENIEKEFGVDSWKLASYLELRKFGTVPHSGFGVGFDRLVMLATGVKDIRDVIPFPRFSDHCDY